MPLKIHLIVKRILAMLLPVILGPVNAAADRNSEVLASMQGNWHIEGYNYILSISEKQWVQYALTSISCKAIAKGQGSLPFDVTDHREATKRMLSEGISRYQAVRVPFPARCSDDKLMSSNDVLYNFDVFWSYFYENYANFEVHNINWLSVRDNYRKTIERTPTAHTLWQSVSEIIRDFGDAHVSVLDAEHKPMRSAEGGQGSSLFSKLIDTYGERLDPKRNSIEAIYLSYKNRVYETTLEKKLSDTWRIGNDQIWGGRLSESVAYVAIHYMYGFVEGEAKGHVPDIIADSAALEFALNLMMEKIQPFETLIIDVRMNPGGRDKLALAIANRFAKTKTLAFSKKAKFGDDFTASQNIYVHPAEGKKFSGDVVLLTSERTGSAAEIFTLAMRTMKHVRVMGSKTAGGLSDAHTFVLPNSWRLSLSNEVYTAADGVCYEGLGIPPSHYLNSFSGPNLEESFISVIDQVLDLL